jgi:8-oxo-dGTP diphosphatase
MSSAGPCKACGAPPAVQWGRPILASRGIEPRPSANTTLCKTCGAAVVVGTARKLVEVVSAVVLHEGRVLLTQRPAGKDFAFSFETPGGKVEKGETHEQALRREFREELDGDLVDMAEKPMHVSAHEDVGVTIAFYVATVRPFASSPRTYPRPVEGQGMIWANARELTALALTKSLTPGTAQAMGKIWELLMKRRGQMSAGGDDLTDVCDRIQVAAIRGKAPPALMRAELHRSWREGATRLWAEDECLLRDPDAERLGAAWRRLFGEDCPEKGIDHLDEGDSSATLHENDRVVVLDCSQCHEIWVGPAYEKKEG